jgi:2-succinyl-6-hydroxy-2,4-cyclohexadiene-1-carboxylate synthase
VRVQTDDGVALEAMAAGDGPGLLLVHGFGGAKEDFADHFDRFAATHRVVAFDHRGHGESDKPDDVGAYSFDRLARDVLAVADAAGLDRFRLLGHSMGGMVSRKVAIRHPDRVDALVMMDTSPGPIPGFDPELVEIGATIALEQGKEELKAVLDMAKTLDTPAHQRVLAERPGYQEFNDRKWDALSPVMWATLVREIAHQADDLDAMRALTMPVLVLVGEQDAPLVGPSHAMADAIAGASLVVVPDAGHSPQFENPDAWFDALNGFLASLATAAPAAPVAPVDAR